jgi:hypothetical protein
MIDIIVDICTSFFASERGCQTGGGYLQTERRCPMKKIFLLFGVLVLFVGSGAYAAEDDTWGRIKATFSEEVSLADAYVQFFPDEAFPSALAKPGGRKSRKSGWRAVKNIKARRGGTVLLEKGWVKMALVIQPRALSRNLLAALSAMKDRRGNVLLGVQGDPHQSCDPPAELTIEIPILLEYVSQFVDGTLMHGMEGSWVPVDNPKLKERMVKALSQWGWEPVDITIEVQLVDWDTALVKITAYLPGFSRYAFSRCR